MNEFQENSNEQLLDQDTDTITVSRHVVNYIIIAIVFFALGAVMGVFVFPSQNAGSSQTAALPPNFETIIRDAVADVLVESGLVQDPGPQQGDRYEVAIGAEEQDPFWGDPNAAITVIEFSDFTCGFCGRFASETLPALREEYGDQIRFVYMDYPILSQMSLTGALAGECADDQDMFWEMHDALFANQRGLSQESILLLAENLGMDMETFSACMTDELHVEEIAADFEYGRSLGIRGTPAFFINGRFINGAQPISVFRTYIEEELARLEGGA